MRRAGIPRDCLQGLEGYSHCWVLYVFHENTDLARLWRADTDADRGLKGKVPSAAVNTRLEQTSAIMILGPLSLESWRRDQQVCASLDPDAQPVGLRPAALTFRSCAPCVSMPIIDVMSKALHSTKPELLTRSVCLA